MPRLKRSDAEIQATQTRILDAAYALLLKNGPKGLTSRAIAKQVGMSHMSLFTTFKNQAAILAALRAREMVRWHDQQAAVIQHLETQDVTRVVSEMLELYTDFASQNPNLYHLAWVMPETGMETREENRQRMQATVASLAALLQRGMEEGAFTRRDPTLAAATTLGMVNMPHILYHSGKLADPALRDRMVQETLEAALGYLKK